MPTVSPQPTKATKLPTMWKCKYCGLNLSRSTHLKRHEELYCKNKINVIEENEILKEENAMLKKEKFNKITNVSTINNNHGNVNTNNIQNNNIHIHSYGKEDFSYIDDQTLLLAHRAPFISIPHLVTKMFFNDEHPENQNVKWKNKKINYMQRLENGENGPEWVNRDKNEVIRDLNDRAYNKIDCVYTAKTTGNSEYQKNHYECFVLKYDSEDKVTLKRLMKETERLILNKRETDKIK
jgi:hypothetical protein